VSAALYDGQAKALAGSPDEARAQYASALKLMPRDVRLHWYAAAAAQMSKDFDSALAHSDAAIQEEPGMSDVWYTRGVILKAAGRDGDAEKAYRTALRLNPGAAMAWNNLGNLLGIRGRFREAEQAQRRALRFDPALKEARQNLAITLLMLKRSEEARRIMEGGQP
jgi:Flp pilus assembly protein TadD